MFYLKQRDQEHQVNILGTQVGMCTGTVETRERAGLDLEGHMQLPR